jgi:predicted N-acetyltransferase YhbS
MDGQIAGHIAFSPITISSGAKDWYGLGPISVLPGYQGQGIGKALVNEGVSLLKEMGGRGCALVGDPNYYKRFGFQNFPELMYEGVPQEFFLALSFTGKVPEGIAVFHKGFLAKESPMKVEYAEPADFDAWIALAREVEPLFGPMGDEVPFQEAIKQAIVQKTAFCMCSDPDDKKTGLKGGIVISQELNEILWLAVSEQYRGKGYGRGLLEFAISKLNHGKRILVQTFDASSPEGRAARKLYLDFGFTDYKDGGLNPAGIPTVIMQCVPSSEIG